MSRKICVPFIIPASAHFHAYALGDLTLPGRDLPAVPDRLLDLMLGRSAFDHAPCDMPAEIDSLHRREGRALQLMWHALRRGLEGAGAEKEIDDVAFVGLQPIELDGGNGADVQTINVGGIQEFAAP